MDVILTRMKFSSAFIRNTSKLPLPFELNVFERHVSCLNTWLRNDDIFDRCSNTTGSYGSVAIKNIIKNHHFRSPVFYSNRLYSNSTQNENTKVTEKSTAPKQSIFQKMKQMTKDYWYILIPVHVITSLGWVSIFYICSKNGIDFVKVMEYLHLSEKYVDMLKSSNAGHWAITYAMYKIFTPLRYTVTLGGTTMSIRYLNKWGYLRFKHSKKAMQSSKYAMEEKPNKLKLKQDVSSIPPKT